MRVGVGYSDNHDASMAGVQAAMNALKDVGPDLPCDLILMFATAKHDAGVLRDAVCSVVGGAVPIVGGAAVGAITNDNFGYAGDQVILAAFWFDKVRCDILAEGGLEESEEAVGHRLGQRMGALGLAADSPVALFYDAIDRQVGQLRMIMATSLLKGIEEGLGFLPNLVGAGLQGDFNLSQTSQWTGRDTSSHNALALAFSGGYIRIDNVIMHGCQPATSYYTVTKADRQTVLEINGQPALQFTNQLFGEYISPEEYPFFLILGMNQGDKWAPFNENSYATRLCLAIDRARNGLVMFEPDMVEGTEFQIMSRSVNLDYIAPSIENLFVGLRDRRPVLAMYIDCAGRAAGYTGTDLEDALTVQKAVAGRAPLLGIYTGAEIAPVEGRPRGLSYTGVFSLFSVPQ